MRRHFAAIYRLSVAHDLLDKGMPRFGLDSGSTFFGNNILCVPDDARIMSNLGSGFFF